MRRVYACLVVGAIVAAGCGGETADEPHEFADELLVAVQTGDNTRWLGLMAKDAVAAFPDGAEIAVFGDAPWVRDDFDGDGISSWADDMQFRNAMHAPSRQHMDWVCDKVGVDTAECTVTATDGFIEGGDGPPIVTVMTFTFMDGKCVRDNVEPVDPASIEASNEAWATTMNTYERWVNDNHADRYTDVFHGPCCDSDLVKMPESVDTHNELLVRFFETTTD